VERNAGLALVAGIVATAVALVALALVALPSRTLTIDELREGVDFVLGGVRVQETYFHDLSQIDAGTTVAFLVHFPDGARENLSMVFQTFLCTDVQVMSLHRGPGVLLSSACGSSSVLVALF